MTPSARVPGAADVRLVSAVADRLRSGRFAPSEYLDSIAEGNWCVKAAEAALAAAGRVLVERLDALAKQNRADIPGWVAQGAYVEADRAAVRAGAFSAAAFSIVAACGAPSPEGADDGSGR